MYKAAGKDEGKYHAVTGSEPPALCTSKPMVLAVVVTAERKEVPGDAVRVTLRYH